MRSNTHFQIFYRGDSRIPEELFKGLTAKKPLPKDTPIPFKLFNHSYSIPEGISITEEFNMATLFPLGAGEGQKPKTFVYVVAVDTKQNDSQYINLNLRSLTEVTEVSSVPGERAKEHLVAKILDSHILCAIPIERTSHIEITGLEAEGTLKLHTHFNITGEAIENPAAKTFLEENPDITDEFKKIKAMCTSKMKFDQLIPMVTETKQLGKKLVFDAAFYMSHKLPADLVTPGIKPPKIKREFNPEFFKCFEFKDSLGGMLFSSKQQLYTENALFYSRIRQDAFSDQIKAEHEKLVTMIDDDNARFFKKCPPALLTHIKQKIENDPESLKELNEEYPKTKLELGL